MYLSIKAYSKESFKKFYKTLGGSNTSPIDDVVFDRLIFDQTDITFYSNLTILFKNSISNELKEKINIIIDKTLYVGSDEVGVGESIGPIVVCALKFKNLDAKTKVILNGIKDSKKLTAKEVSEKATFIKKYSEYYTIILEPKKFNEVYKKVPNVKHINALLQNELHKKFEGRGLKHITDQFVNEKKYKEYISNSDNKPFQGELLLLTKAEEKYLEVSAAAIISKDIYNTWVLDNLKKDNINYEIKVRLNAWHIFQKIESGEYKVKDKDIYIKRWKK